MEFLADIVKGNINRKNSEHFHEFLRDYTAFFYQYYLCYKRLYLSSPLWYDPK